MGSPRRRTAKIRHRADGGRIPGSYRASGTPAAQETRRTQTDDAQALHPAAPLRPAGRRERLVAIDAMRGVALLGILLINVQYFQGPEPWLEGPAAAWRGLDRVLFLLAGWLVEGKFVSMFAFLFGVGMALQLRRAADGGAAPVRLLVRRLLVLGGFGLLHATLVWYGDILATYAVTGLLLLLFRKRSVAALRAWGAGLLGTACGVLVLFAVVTLAANGLDTAAAPPAPGANALAESGVAAYTSGDYGQMLRQRLRELAVAAASFPFNLPWILGLMLLGLATGRSGLLADLEGHAPLLRRLTAAGLGIGLPVALLAALGQTADPGQTTGAGFAGQTLLLAGAPVLAMGYLALGALVFDRTADAPLTRRLAATGRMAFTNYLLQSVLGTAVYYGFGLYGRGSLSAAFAFWAVLSALQLLWSPWWLARHEHGPMEWLWRRLTYGRPG